MNIMATNNYIEKMQFLGVGIAFIPNFIKLLNSQGKFNHRILPSNSDFFEISSLDEKELEEEEILEWFPLLNEKKITAHILGFRVGTKLGPSDEFLTKVNKGISIIKPAFISEDLSQFRVIPTAIDTSPVLLTDESKKYCIDALIKIRETVDVPFLLENPPISFIVGEQDFLKWFSDCLNLSDSYCLLDIGHLLSLEAIVGDSIINRLRDFPLDRVVEVHLAQGIVDYESKYYADLHGEPYSERLYEILLYILGNCPNLKAVTLEHFNLFTALSTGLNDLQRVRELTKNFFVSKGAV